MKIKDVVRTSKYVNWKLAKKIPDLLSNMVRNRVAFIVDEQGQHFDNIEQAFRILMIEFCEDQIQGLWTYKGEGCFYDHNDNIVDPYDDVYANDGYGSQVVFSVYFEHANDADLFVKNFLVLYKLSN